jgi:hypothetical protein
MISSCFGKKLDADLFRKSLLDMAQIIDQLLSMNSSVFPYNCEKQNFDFTVTDTSYIKQKGLSEAVRLCFGKILDKSEQMSNWEKRPLRRKQITYAGRYRYS